MQTIDVVERGYLARGMAVKGHARIERRHAAPVVDNLYKLQTRITVVHRNGAGTGVDGVLHHLLDHRCGTVDDLARSNLVGDDFG